MNVIHERISTFDLRLDFLLRVSSLCARFPSSYVFKMKNRQQDSKIMAPNRMMATSTVAQVLTPSSSAANDSNSKNKNNKNNSNSEAQGREIGPLRQPSHPPPSRCDTTHDRRIATQAALIIILYSSMVYIPSYHVKTGNPHPC